MKDIAHNTASNSPEAEPSFDRAFIEEFRDEHQGCLLCDDGSEIPITEEMICKACMKLQQLPTVPTLSGDTSGKSSGSN